MVTGEQEAEESPAWPRSTTITLSSDFFIRLSPSSLIRIISCRARLARHARAVGYQR